MSKPTSIPQAPESEKVLLGTILIDNTKMAQTVDRLTPDDFYVPLLRHVYSAMIRLFDASKPIDPILIGDELEKEKRLESIGGVSVITNLSFGIPNIRDLTEHIKLVKDASDSRKLIRICESVIADTMSQEDTIEVLLERAETAIYSIRSGTEATKATHMSDEVGKAIELAKERATTGNVVIGIPTGFHDIDIRLQGLRPNQYIIMAARPSVGKTSLGLQMLQNIAIRCEQPTLIFSLEMAKSEMADRSICSEANIDSYLLRSGHLTHEQWDKANQVKARLEGGAPFFINDSPSVTVRTIRTEIRRINATLRKQGKKLEVVAVDHVGLMNNVMQKGGRSRENELSEISKNLKQIAREFELSLVALSQLNRQSEDRTDHRPTLRDLRDSGSLEQDADVVMLLYREDMFQKDPELHNNLAEVIIAKNRNGPTGPIKLYFTRKSTRFSDMSEPREESDFNIEDIVL